MKIAVSIFVFLLLSANSYSQTIPVFEVSTNQVKQGELFSAWIQPQWQAPFVCLSFMGKDYQPNQYGLVNFGIDVNTKLGKYPIFIVECGRGVKLEQFYEEVEILENKFPETKIRRKLVLTSSQRRKREASLIGNAYSRADTWKEYRESSFISPLDEITVTGPFGVRRIYLDGETRHGGVDLRAPNRTPIKAINSGVVLLAERNFSLEGNMVMIDHGSGVISVYLHLSRLDVKQGDTIKNGSVIGLSGSTGSTTGPHLHLIIKINGINVDPLSAIQILNQHL